MNITSAAFEQMYTVRQADGMVRITAVLFKLFIAVQKIWYVCALFSVTCLSRQWQSYYVIHQFKTRTLSKVISVWENRNLHIAAEPCSSTDWKTAHPWPHCIKDSFHIIGCDCSMLPCKQHLLDCCWDMEAHFMPLYLAGTRQEAWFLD